MIPKSALEALTQLLHTWRNGPEGLTPGERTIYVDYRRACADDLALVLQSLEPTEARAEAEGRSDMESIRFAATVATDRILKEYARMVLKSRDFMPEKMRDIIAEEFYSLASPLPKAETQEAVAPNSTLKQLVDKFLAWPLPASVCPDLCTNVTKDTYPGTRIGTMLLTAIEAEEMIKYLGLYPCPCHPAVKQTMRSHEVELRCSHLNGCKNIMEELKEHTNAAQGEDAYLRIYPCDARKIMEAANPAPEAATIDAEGAIKTISNIALRALIDFDHKKISMEHAAAIVANESLRLLSQHASEHAGKQGWQPIETAPKDGKRVLLYWGGEVISGFYLDNSKTAVPWEGWSTGSGVPAKLGKPTHWHPYAAAPD